ncbi:MAG: hypothetical protein HQK70_05150 [Desulfamplus sp.]|nr:hypothetical protein [Desulfamplus sp.]
MPSLGSTARIINNSNSNQPIELFTIGQSKVSTDVKLKIVSRETPNTISENKAAPFEDQFLNLKEFLTPESDFIKKAKHKSLDDILLMMQANQWDNIISLYYPVDEKNPELVVSGADLPIREKVAFALGQLQRFDEAIAELETCIKREPENFYTRSSLGYIAYNSLFALKNREIMLTPQVKAQRIALAHTNFAKARQLKPDNVTCFYREGMLYTQIENKPDPAIPLFSKACLNWEKLTGDQRLERHQEKKNYIKSLYRLASLILEKGDAKGALARITICIAEDEKRNYLSPSFKYFALGKVYFQLGSHEKAKDALVFAMKSGTSGQPDQFVVELLARTLLALGESEKALELLRTVPEKMKRPYFRWTESDVLCSLHCFKEAEQTLRVALERDMMSKHKTLIRLVKIHYMQRDFERAEKAAAQAVQFFRQQWNNPYNEGLFWQSLATFRMGRRKEAETLAMELQKNCPHYSKLGALLATIKEG